VIRLATPSDLPALLEVERACFGREAWTEKMLTEELEHPHARVLATLPEGGIVGFVAFRILLDECHVHDVAVHPDHRRRGLAHSLLEKSLAHAADAGVTTCHLEVAEGNAAARALYTRTGFTEIGRRPRYYPRGEAAILMSLQLAVPSL